MSPPGHWNKIAQTVAAARDAADLAASIPGVGRVVLAAPEKDEGLLDRFDHLATGDDSVETSNVAVGADGLALRVAS